MKILALFETIAQMWVSDINFATGSWGLHPILDWPLILVTVLLMIPWLAIKWLAISLPLWLPMRLIFHKKTEVTLDKRVGFDMFSGEEHIDA